MPISAFLNQKGGVGKTSTSYHLSGTLAQMGRKVLLVDCDPQASLTQGFIGPDGMRALPAKQTIASIFAGNEPFPGQVIRPVMPGIDLLAGSKQAKRFNNAEPPPETLPRSLQFCIREFLAEVRGKYDHVLIDCPPNLHLCSWSALAAADHLIVPLLPEDFGAQGIIDVREWIAMVQAGPNPGLTLAGYLVNRMSRKEIHKYYADLLRELYGEDVFTAVIPESGDFLEAVLARKPIAQYKPKGAAGKAVRALAEEMETRLAARRAA